MKTLDFEHPERPLIGFNGRFLVAKRTGVQRSAYRLLCSLLDCGERFNFVLFTGEEEASAPEWKRPNLRTIPCRLSQSVVRNHMWEQFSLPRLAAAYGVDILHNPANLSPFFYRGKSIINVHDVCFMVEPRWFSWSFRFIYSLLVPRLARSASIVVTNSNNSKNDILEFLRVPVSKVRLAYWSVEPLFADFCSSYASREDRMLFVGSLEPRKNLAGLLAAFNIFRERHPERQTKLSVVGCENALFASQSYDLGRFAADIDFVGYVNDSELAMLYSKSKLLVYPSFYEGFGFPPLEAMVTGTPVVTSWNSSLPEVVGDAALLVNPAEASQIASCMEQVLCNEQLALDLIEKGKKRVNLFNWERVASHTLSIYDELLAAGRKNA